MIDGLERITERKKLSQLLVKIIFPYDSIQQEMHKLLIEVVIVDI
jgi:hypothetical protein